MAEPSIVTCATCGTRSRVPAAASGRPRCSSCHTDLPWLVDAGDADFDEVVGGSPLPVLVDCWAAWCGPCRAVSPLVEHAATARAGSLKVAKVDVDANPEVARRLGVQGIPALFVVEDGRVVDQQVGALPGAALDAWLDRTLSP
jgi:thioredoxin 2